MQWIVVFINKSFGNNFCCNCIIFIFNFYFQFHNNYLITIGCTWRNAAIGFNFLDWNITDWFLYSWSLSFRHYYSFLKGCFWKQEYFQNCLLTRILLKGKLYQTYDSLTWNYTFK